MIYAKYLAGMARESQQASDGDVANLVGHFRTQARFAASVGRGYLDFYPRDLALGLKQAKLKPVQPFRLVCALGKALRVLRRTDGIGVAQLRPGEPQMDLGDGVDVWNWDPNVLDPVKDIPQMAGIRLFWGL